MTVVMNNKASMSSICTFGVMHEDVKYKMT